MKVNSNVIVFILDLIGAVALAASGVIVKHYNTASSKKV